MVVLGEGVEPSNLPTFFPSMRFGEYPELHLQRCGGCLCKVYQIVRTSIVAGELPSFGEFTTNKQSFFKGYTKNPPPFVCG